jgi:hypothetical protein
MAMAKFAAKTDFPTPPLPPVTANMMGPATSSSGNFFAFSHFSHRYKGLGEQQDLGQSSPPHWTSVHVKSLKKRTDE